MIEPMTNDELDEMRKYLRPLGPDYAYKQDRDRARLLATIDTLRDELRRLRTELRSEEIHDACID